MALKFYSMINYQIDLSHMPHFNQFDIYERKGEMGSDLVMS